MKKEVLQELGLTEEQITAVLKENETDLAAEHKKTQSAELERDNYKGQLETAQTALKEFEGVDVKELQGKIQTLTNDMAAKEAEYQGKIADMQFTDLLKGEIQKRGGRNEKAIMGILDVNALKESKDQSKDITAALDAIKESDAYLFGSDEPIDNPVILGGGTGGIDSNTATLRAAMGLSAPSKE
ncbi:phage scaffolding protein [Blautia schinkii]|nr:phage scaffolding protein [Blautia schinkii]